MLLLDNTVRKERLSIWVNVITDVAELLRMFFPGTHISLFQTFWFVNQQDSLTNMFADVVPQPNC